MIRQILKPLPRSVDVIEYALVVGLVAVAARAIMPTTVTHFILPALWGLH